MIKPRKLQNGDTIATISPSWGIAGETDVLWRYEIGKKRLQDVFGLNVVNAPNSLCGERYLKDNPKSRAEDLMWAFENKEVKVIQIVAFGDDYNNFEMIIEYGIGVAMGNAIGEVKAVAEYLCDTNDNDEVAKLFEEILCSSPGSC